MEPPRSRARRHTALTLVASVALAALPASALPRLTRGGYEQGQRIEVTGLVTDPAGRPLGDVQVVLELGRVVFDFRTFGRTTKKVTPVTATTNARGEYTIAFPWDDFYNSFDLVVGVPVRGAGGEKLTELERQDLSRRIERGTPVVATVVVENAAFIRNLREFLATVDSDDERRVYEQLGRPDKVQVTQFPGRDETAWWYFRSGRVYRFADGVLRGSEQFDPVREFRE
ncbi:MAG TPA: hypothetical protein VMR44_07500 [Thermoanaerobaculia bacterium]|nr:hypothetical protein [Thermoanaerobaculia bacterium]